ncbi:NADP-dependent oxidoreductase [Paenibacillus campi]|uniref:NADP-dependent oxidoreductase n=1 Tax=Paenibacillus campi TaxID=3106031 RepID=UPI002AFE0A5B|nr:NADP-dependent oxidoreductase [Paenibacillus sp. SGZ-1014]
MKAVVIEQYGDEHQLQLKDVPDPKPGPKQVIIKLKATSINPIDWKLREGHLKSMMDWEFPIILGWDAAGIITEVGDEVTEWKIGDAVFARPETTRFGTYAEYTAIDDHLLAPMPPGISFEEAASVPLAGLTAWQALFDHGQLQAGEKVLIHAGAGGVGTLAIQLAKHAGAHVVTTASSKNADFLTSLGADEVIDYKTTSFVDVLSDVDLVFDTMGGQIQADSFKVLKQGSGRLISILEQPDEKLAKQYDVVAKSIWLQPDGKQLQQFGKLMEQRKVNAIVGTTLPFSEQGLREAHRLSATHHAKGKIVISFAD